MAEVARSVNWLHWYFNHFRPGGSVFLWTALLPNFASGAGARRDILTRKMSAKETSESLLF